MNYPPLGEDFSELKYLKTLGNLDGMSSLLAVSDPNGKIHTE